MSEKVSLIVDGKGTGSWNMALDRALLEQAASSGKITVRTYGWEPATVSLGYFQSHLDRSLHVPSARCPFVRRATGGGAIVHDDELTYSIALPGETIRSRLTFDLYRRVHRTLIAALQHFGVAGCTFHEDSSSGAIDRGKGDSNPEFLCFLRRSPGDVVLKGFKIIGSAQRRFGSALLQHGSVLLSRSVAAPELPGVNQLWRFEGRSDLFAAELLDIWPRCLESEFGWQLEKCRPSDELEMRASGIVEQVFGSRDWNEKR
jgi:lipoyl(octanoyl) transferase